MSFATEQLARIERVLAENPGVSSINVDGVQVTYAELMAQRRDLKSEIARERGRGPVVSRICLGGNH